MSLFSIAVAVGSLLTLVSGAPVSSTLPTRDVALTESRTPLSHLVERAGDSYRMYSGTGALSQGWPSMSAWVGNYDTMFNNNKVVMQQSCSQFGVPNNSGQETVEIYNAIKMISAETAIDARYILAVMMQESNGCVRAPTTNGGVRNPGLMQDHNGWATCNENGVKNPCPANLIQQMIREGAAGTSYGDGLKQLLARAGGDDSKYYRAARMYNSGSIAASGDLGDGIATHCYASDIANRLTGWVTAPHGCCLDRGCPNTPAPGTPAPAPAPAPGTAQPTGPKAPGASAQCTKWYTVVSGDYCAIVQQKFGISFDQFRRWNTGIDAGCTNLWLGYSYCVLAP